MLADGHAKWLQPTSVSGGPTSPRPDCPQDLNGNYTPTGAPPTDCTSQSSTIQIGSPFGSSAAGTGVSTFAATFSLE